MTISFTERAVACACLVIAILLLASCGSGDGPVVQPTPKEAQCNGVATSVRSLAPFESVVISGSAAACFALAGGDREYLVVPQLTGAALPYGGYAFRLGDPSPTAVTRTTDEPSSIDRPALTAMELFGDRERLQDAQSLLDARMRQREIAWRPSSLPAPTRPSLSVAGISAPPESLRTFSVLNTLDVTPSYTPVAARLRYSGSKVLVYLDTLATTSLSDADIAAMGAIYDTNLIPTDNAAFGSGSDIDGNGRVIFLLTPAVNALVTTTACATSGYVRGFFYNHDLGSTDATSNMAEIFYAYVPDDAGRWSCAHTKPDVLANLPPTFIHELQHMISFGEHAIKRGGVAEEVWLNEGLSHMAEELGSLVYEARFPAPSGRTNAAQVFPDSAAPYITPNVLYSYRYLFSSGVYSITSCAPGTFCTLAERGGTWLFLRWLADHQGATIFRRLDETILTGRANLEAVTGRSTSALVGDFALAVSADSVIGQSRTAAPANLRFASRNLRRIYRSLFDTFGIFGGVSRPYPIEPLTLTPGATLTGTMRPGTFLTYRLRVPATVSSAVLRMSGTDGTAFPTDAGAQVSILRLP
jgi:hypothetical protein